MEARTDASGTTETPHTYVFESSTSERVYTVGVREVEGDGFVMRSAFHIGGRPYYVERNASGRVRVTPQGCEAYFFRGKCKHLDEALELYLQHRR